jgi:hypothetical protein
MPGFQPDHSTTVRAGRADVRVIESAAVLAEWEGDDENIRAKWQRILRSAQVSLRKLVAELPASVTAGPAYDTYQPLVRIDNTPVPPKHSQPSVFSRSQRPWRWANTLRW